jgi:hypothetical protein
LPKRKLRLWYNKDDYKKEREELAKQSEQLQNENMTQPKVTDETAQPLESDTKLEQIDTDNKAVPIEVQNHLPQTETENLATPSSEGNIHPTETPAAQATETQTQESESDNKAQPELVNEPAAIESETKEAPVQSASTATPIESEAQPLPAQNEPQVPVENENRQTPTESPVAAIESPTPSETETKQTLAETTSPPPVEPTKEEETETETKVPLTESVQNIEKFTDTLKSLLPTKAVVCVGEYPINILLKGSFTGKKEVLPIFVEKSSKDVIKWGQGQLDKNNIACLDEDIDTHFWYDILQYVADKESFFAKIKSKPIEKLQGAIIVSSTWNGVGSALLPTLNSQFKELNINSIALALLPSKAQPLDGQFNSFASIGILASKDSTTAILVDRDNLENFTGVDRNGFAINGNGITNYLIDLMLTKDTFVRELGELSKTFGSKMFTVLLAPGESWKIYGTLENILNTTLVRPLYTFDLSTATLIYVLIRMPYNLKDKLPRGKIELAVANWFKDKADLESIYITDPVYVEDSSDRIDIVMFVGGFDTTTRFAELAKRLERMKNKAVKKGSITEENWLLITKSLVE